MKRSVLAIAAGLFIGIVSGVLTRPFHMHPAIILAIKLVDLVVAGYVVAVIAKRAPITHILIAEAILLAFSLLSALTKPEHQVWLQQIPGFLAVTIYLTWGALFRKWQISKLLRLGQNETKKTSLPRSVFAIIVGFSVYMLYGALSDAFFIGQPASTFDLYGVIVRNLLAGFLTAFISKEAQFRDIFITTFLCLVVPIVLRILTEVNCDWGRWIVGALTVTICMTWSGLFNILRLQKRINANAGNLTTPYISIRP